MLSVVSLFPSTRRCPSARRPPTSVLLSMVALLAVLAAATASPAVGQQTSDTAVPEVIVSASRIGAGMPGASVTVVTGEELRASPAATLPGALGLEAGVQTWDLFGGTDGARATIDIRGFGATGTQNTLVLINGRRLNELDLSAVDWASIPRDSIERVEIVRGNAGAVLYGDGAVGGVINIVTKAPSVQPETATAGVAWGSNDYRGERFSLVRKAGAFAINAYGSGIQSNGDRINNDLLQRSLVTEARHTGDKGDAFVHLALDDQWLGLPGGRLVDPALGINELTKARDAPATRDDYGRQNTIALTLGGTRSLGDGLDLVLDGGVRTKGQITNSSGIVDSTLATISLVPRLIAEGALGGRQVRGTLGFDYYYADYDSDRKSDSETTWNRRFDANQHSVALYGQGMFAVAPATDVTLGLRGQVIDFQGGMLVNTTAPGGAFQTPIPGLAVTAHEYAVTLGVEHRVTDQAALFARVGRSMRLPTVDERISTVSSTFDLRTQHSRDVEAGGRLRFGDVSVQSSAYGMWLDNELHFNPEGLGCTGTSCFGANTNLDRTRRHGAEASVAWRARPDLALKGNLAYTRAEFVDGRFSGNDVPLVAPWTIGTGVVWDLIADKLSASATANYVSSKRMENDERNFQPRIPEATVVDMKLSGTWAPATWSLEVNNLLDEDFFGYAVASGGKFGRYNAYPMPGRTFLARLDVEF